jgi:peptide/nickel transport system permease protein
VNYFLRRILQLLAILLITTFFTASLIRLKPGDPAVLVCAKTGSQECVERMREQLNLNDSVPVAYGKWLSGAVRGDFGTNPQGQQITPTFANAFPTTLALVIYSQIIALTLAIPAALFAAKRADRLFDRFSSGLAFVLLALPSYVLGVILLVIFPFKFNTGVFDLRAYLPAAIALACTDFAIYLRLFRSDLISTLQEDYITMAKAKGLSPRRILWRHAFRPSSFTLLTSAGLNFGRLIGGTLVIEIIFNLPGMGLEMYNAITGSDTVTLLAGVTIVVFAFVIILFLIDVLYGALDPRIRHARSLT